MMTPFIRDGGDHDKDTADEFMTSTERFRGLVGSKGYYDNLLVIHLDYKIGIVTGLYIIKLLHKCNEYHTLQ